MDPNNPFETPFDEPGKKEPSSNPNPFSQNPPPPPNPQNNPYSQNNPYQQPPPGNQFNQGISTGYEEQVPNGTAVLVLGILSLVFALCYGVVGLILAIIALILASSGVRAYEMNPARYSMASYNNLKAGKVCAFIGLALSAIVFLIVIFAIFAAIINDM